MTNNNAIRPSTADRQYFIPDISTKYIGNHDYFDRLSEALEVNHVGEAFYAYMKDIATANRKFKEKIILKTVTKQDQIIDSLHSIHIFIKEFLLSLSILLLLTNILISVNSLLICIHSIICLER